MCGSVHTSEQTWSLAEVQQAKATSAPPPTPCEGNYFFSPRREDAKTRSGAEVCFVDLREACQALPTVRAWRWSLAHAAGYLGWSLAYAAGYLISGEA